MSFISLRKKKETTTRHPALTSPSPESLPVLSSTYCSQIHCYFVDVMYHCFFLSDRPSVLSSLTKTTRLKIDSREEQWTVWQEDSGQTLWGCGVEGHLGLCTHASEPFLAPSCTRVARKMSRKEGQSEDSATKQSVTLCVVVLPFHSPSLHLTLSPFFLSLIGAHSLVFHHTYPHLNFTNPIYCYLYP